MKKAFIILPSIYAVLGVLVIFISEIGLLSILPHLPYGIVTQFSLFFFDVSIPGHLLSIGLNIGGELVPVTTLFLNLAFYTACGLVIDILTNNLKMK